MIAKRATGTVNGTPDVPSKLPESFELQSDNVLGQKAFRWMLALERKRAERSGGRFILMLADVHFAAGSISLESFVSRLSRSTRDTDVKGWYESGSVFGVLFSEIGNTGIHDLIRIMTGKVMTIARSCFEGNDAEMLSLAFHVFPELGENNSVFDLKLYPDQVQNVDEKWKARAVKRAIDVIGSVAGIVVLAPVLAGVAVAIKLTSRGPVLFRQLRLGQFGRTFWFLKFRSMYNANDDSIHKAYVTGFIRDTEASEPSDTFKLRNDPRITLVGHFLRRTSLDELPQLINVLLGHMSLVGPRPPIAYEFNCYEPWHRRRLLTVKPGITGLWQVSGRSRVRFNEMVRMDLKYADSWSVWLDLSILLRTPSAVLSGNGAY